MTKQRINEARWIESRQRWQINVQQDGMRKTFTCSIAGKKGKVECERKADKWLESFFISENARFQKLWDDFLEETKKLTSYSNYVNLESIGRIWLLPELKHKRVTNIRPQDWQDCINKAAEAGRSKKTCSNIRGAITSFYRYTKKKKIQIISPEDLVIPKRAPVAEKQILQPDDLKTLFAQDHVMIRGSLRPCFYIHAWRFMVLTGVRRGELCGLQNKDIADGIVHIRRSINQYGEVTEGKTKAAKRYFVMSSYVKSVLEAQRLMLKKMGIISEYVFPDENGMRTDPNILYDRWLTYRNQYGISCSLHEMRHTLISVAKADVPEELLKRAVGHTLNMDTFGVYGHDVEGEMKRVADILDGIFSRLLK